MARPRKNANNSELLRAALDGLELQRSRVEEQIAQVRSMLGQGERRRGRPPGSKNTAKRAAGVKRTLSPAARKRIAAAQKLRWAEHRKRKAESSGGAS